MANRIWMEWKRQWLVGLVIVGVASPAFAVRYPSAAFTAVTSQGRPMTGATFTVVDSVGAPVTACNNEDCDSAQTIVPASGIAQFWADVGVYTVTLSGAGETRIFTANIINPTGASGVTSINGETGPAITVATGSSGTDFALVTTTNTLTFNLPSASLTARGLVTTAAQEFNGTKTFDDGIIDDAGLIVNNGQAGGLFQVRTNLYTNAIETTPATDQIGFFTSNASLLNAMTVFDTPIGSAGFFTMWVQNSTASGTALFAAASGNGTTYGLSASASGSSDGAALLATSSNTTSQAGKFVRGNAGSVPMVSMDRNSASDTQPILQLTDATSTAVGVPLVYNRNGTDYFAVNKDGKLLSDGGYSFEGNSTTGIFDNISNDLLVVVEGDTFATFDAAAGEPTIETVAIAISKNGANTALSVIQLGAGRAMDIIGEVRLNNAATVSGVLCTKTDGDIGQCTSVVGAGGTCTCA